MERRDLELKHAVSARRKSIDEVNQVVGSPALKLKSVEGQGSDRSAPMLESGTTVHSSKRPEMLGEIRRRASSTESLKHVGAVKDRSAPRIEPGVKIKSTSSYKNALMNAAAVGARRVSNAELKGYPEDVVLRSTPVQKDRSAPMVPSREEMKKTPIKMHKRKEVLEEMRKRSMSSDKDLRHVDAAAIKDRSKPVIASSLNSQAAKKKSKKKKELLSEVRAKGARRLSNSQIKGFENTGVVLKDTEVVDKSAPVLPKANEVNVVKKKSTRNELVKEIRRRSLSSDKDLKHVSLREVKTNDSSAPVVLEIMPRHSSKRPAVMDELRERADNGEENKMGLNQTPTKKIKNRSAPKLDGMKDVMKGSKRRKEMLADVRSVGSRNLANRQIKHSSMSLTPTTMNDRSAPVVAADDVGELKKNPRPAVMQELKKRSATVTGGDLTKTLSPTHERRDRSDPNKELMAEAPSSLENGHNARKELLMDITVRANRKLSNSAIKGFEGVPMLRDAADRDAADKSAPATAAEIVSSSDDGTSGTMRGDTKTQKSKRKDAAEGDRNGKSASGSNGASPAKEKGARNDAEVDDDDDDDDDGSGAAKNVGILATIVLILTCAVCFTRKGRSDSNVAKEKKTDSL